MLFCLYACDHGYALTSSPGSEVSVETLHEALLSDGILKARVMRTNEMQGKKKTAVLISPAMDFRMFDSHRGATGTLH